MDALKMIEK